MATKIILPKLGQTMEEGTIVEWLKKEGDAVNRGDVLFQVESDKAVLEVESTAKGMLRKILVDKGAKVPVLTTVGIIGEAERGYQRSRWPASLRCRPPLRAAARSPAVGGPREPWRPLSLPSALAPIQRERIFASPRARKLAEEKGVDLAYVAGQRPRGAHHREGRAGFPGAPAGSDAAGAQGGRRRWACRWSRSLLRDARVTCCRRYERRGCVRPLCVPIAAPDRRRLPSRRWAQVVPHGRRARHHRRAHGHLGAHHRGRHPAERGGRHRVGGACASSSRRPWPRSWALTWAITTCWP